MDVSENSGTPKSSILIGFSILNHPFWGTTIFRNIHMVLIIRVTFLLYDPKLPVHLLQDKLHVAAAAEHAHPISDQRIEVGW